jgi:hypothetical protein
VSHLAPGATADCQTCGTAVLLLSGLGAELWCHGSQMRPASGVRCSEQVRNRRPRGLEAGVLYTDLATSAVWRCTRSGDGWPGSRTSRLVRLNPLKSSVRRQIPVPIAASPTASQRS